jgi:O-antigen/teichoic acid export membrane protein
MTTLRRAVGNGSIMLVSQLITWTATLIFTGALGRVLGDEGFGKLYIAISMGMVFAVLVDFGLDQQLIRAVARDRGLAASYVVNSAIIKTVLATVAYASVLVLSHLLGYPPDIQLTIAVYCLILFLNGISGLVTAVYQATENVLHSAIGVVIEKCVVAGLALLLLDAGGGVVATAAVFVIGAAIGLGWKVAFILPRIQPLVAPSRQMIRTLVTGTLPFFLYWILASAYYRMDVVLLSKLTDPTVVGWYGAAYRLFDTLVFLPSIVSSAILFPILARLALHSRRDLRHALEKGLGVVLMIGVPISTGLLVLAEPIIHFVYGRSEFQPAAVALRWLAVALILLYVNSVLTAVVVSLNQERKMIIAAGLAALLNFGLNWVLIPQFQHLAAAAVTAGTELFLLTYVLCCIPRDLLSVSSLITLAKATASALVMAVVLYALSGQSLFILVPLGALVYGVTGLLVRLVPAEDLRLLGQSVRFQRGRELAQAEVTQQA